MCDLLVFPCRRKQVYRKQHSHIKGRSKWQVGYVTFLFHREDDNVPVFATAAVVARRRLNQCQEYFEQIEPFYTVDEFQSHFRMRGATFEILVWQMMGMVVLPAGNVFGRKIIHAGKQVYIVLWCMCKVRDMLWL